VLSSKEIWAVDYIGGKVGLKWTASYDSGDEGYMATLLSSSWLLTLDTHPVLGKKKYIEVPSVPRYRVHTKVSPTLPRLGRRVRQDQSSQAITHLSVYASEAIFTWYTLVAHADCPRRLPLSPRT
jgi:hypothetical protein